MSHVDLFALPRPERPFCLKEFSEGEHTLKLAFRALDTVDAARCQMEQKRLVETYLTGIEGVRGPAPFWDDIELSEPLIEAGCLVWAAQVKHPKARFLSSEECILLAVKLPGIWRPVIRLVQNLKAEGEDARGNSPGAPTDSSSVSRSTTTGNIRSTPAGVTPFSSPSTDGSASSPGTLHEKIPAATSSP